MSILDEMALATSYGKYTCSLCEKYGHLCQFCREDTQPVAAVVLKRLRKARERAGMAGAGQGDPDRQILATFLALADELDAISAELEGK